jgi:hypothetical protein
VVGKRDWVIPVECTADAVVLRTARRRFSIARLQGTMTADHPLVRAVQQMIDRRQSLVREGEPPYRPTIRLLVRPDGLKTYYLAYPLLEKLKVPMARQDLEPEVENKAARVGK